MATEDKDKEPMTNNNDELRASKADVIPLTREDFLTNLEKNIFEIQLPSDVYYNFYAMNFYGIFEELPKINQIIYYFFMIVSLIGQIMGVSGIWWAEVGGLYRWADITLDLSEDWIDRFTIESSKILYHNNLNYFTIHQNLSSFYNETIVSFDELNVTQNEFKASNARVRYVIIV